MLTKRKADGEFVRDTTHLSHDQLICETSAEQEGTEDNKMGQTPDHFVGDLHRQQGQQQYKRCCQCRAYGRFVRGLVRLHLFNPFVYALSSR